MQKPTSHDMVDVAIDDLERGNMRTYLSRPTLSALTQIKAESIGTYDGYVTKLEQSGANMPVFKDKLSRFELFEETGYLLDSYNEIVEMNPNKCARFLRSNLDIVVVDGMQIYQYRQGLYSIITELELKRQMRSIIHNTIYPDIWKLSHETAYYSAFLRETPRCEKMDEDKNYLNLNIGILLLGTLQLTKHEKCYYSTIRIPIDYDPTATCPQFEEFLKSVLLHKKPLRLLVQEIMGYCLTPDVSMQKAFILLGDGSNGKSVFTSILQALVGQGNYSNLSIGELSGRFNLSSITGKLLNVSTENELSSALSTEIFKKIVSGDSVKVEQKFRDAYSYTPFVKLMFAMNSVPDINDSSYGLVRRLVVIPFLRRFTGEEIDTDLANKLRTELPGILNYALRGLERLRQNQSFTKSQASDKALNDFLNEAIPLREFILSNIVSSAGGKVSNVQIYMCYEQWCAMKGDKPVYKKGKHFWRYLKQGLSTLQIKTGSLKSNGLDYTTGISLRTPPNNQTRKIPAK